MRKSAAAAFTVPDNGVPGVDKVPALLTPGEVVLPTDTVRATGKPQLERLIAATHRPGRRAAKASPAAQFMGRPVQRKADGGAVGILAPTWKQEIETRQAQMQASSLADDARRAARNGWGPDSKMVSPEVAGVLAGGARAGRPSAPAQAMQPAAGAQQEPEQPAGGARAGRLSAPAQTLQPAAGAQQEPEQPARQYAPTFGLGLSFDNPLPGQSRNRFGGGGTDFAPDATPYSGIVPGLAGLSAGLPGAQAFADGGGVLSAEELRARAEQAAQGWGLPAESRKLLPAEAPAPDLDRRLAISRSVETRTPSEEMAGQARTWLGDAGRGLDNESAIRIAKRAGMGPAQTQQAPGAASFAPASPGVDPAPMGARPSVAAPGPSAIFAAPATPGGEPPRLSFGLPTDRAAPPVVRYGKWGDLGATKPAPPPPSTRVGVTPAPTASDFTFGGVDTSAMSSADRQAFKIAYMNDAGAQFAANRQLRSWNALAPDERGPAPQAVRDAQAVGQGGLPSLAFAAGIEGQARAERAAGDRAAAQFASEERRAQMAAESPLRVQREKAPTDIAVARLDLAKTEAVERGKAAKERAKASADWAGQVETTIDHLGKAGDGIGGGGLDSDRRGWALEQATALGDIYESKGFERPAPGLVVPAILRASRLWKSPAQAEAEARAAGVKDRDLPEAIKKIMSASDGLAVDELRALFGGGQ